jgi:hypothetical protein
MTPSTGSILLTASLFLLVGLYIMRPFLLPQHFGLRRPHVSNRDALEAQKAALLDEIRALDFDYETHKISQAIYEQQRAAAVKEAAAILRQLDTMPAHQPNSVDEQIEAAVARLRAPEVVSAAAVAVPVSAESTPPTPTTPAATRFCPQCGKGVQSDDRFCRACGHQLLV